MAAPCVISDSNSRTKAKVTKFGQLVVAPLAYSTPNTQSLDIIDTAFSFVAPEQGSSIVITDIVISADKNVSPTDPAEVNIFTADDPVSIVAIDSILETSIPRSTTVPITGLNLLVGEGVWVNATTNDDIVKLTIMFYRVPVEDL